MKTLLATLAILAACGSDHRQVEPANVAIATRAPVAVGPQHVAQGPSLYTLPMPLPLHAADGRTISLDVGRGHPTVISMFYGSCAMACPALIGFVQAALANAAPDTRVLLVSFDAARDTPARLSELSAEHHLDARFTLASADPDDARTLAALLGFKYRATATGEFVHNSAITVLDRDGKRLTTINGIGNIDELSSAIDE
jgi:protein SCO1/2